MVGYVGCEIDKNKCVEEKVGIWIKNLENVANLAKILNHTVTTKSLQAEWNFLQHVGQIEEEFFSPSKVLLVLLSSCSYLTPG